MAEKIDIREYPVNRRFPDPYARYQRGPLIRHLPFSMTIVGSRHTGKSEFIQSMMASEMGDLSFDFDDYVYYSNSKLRNRDIKTTPYTNLNRPRGTDGQHSLVVFDDPPMENMDFRRMLNDLMRNGRNQNMSVITVLHSLSDMGLAQNRYVKAHSDLIVLPSRYVNQNMASIRRHNLYPYNQGDLDRLDEFNYNVIDENQHLTVIRRPQETNRR